MKTGDVQDPGDGAEPYLELDYWTPWQYHAPEEEIGRYYSAAIALITKLDRMPPAVRGRLKRIEIRCPVKGCLLATVYWMPRRPTAEEIADHHRRRSMLSGIEEALERPQFSETGDYLYVGRTAGGTEVYDFLAYGFSATPKDDARGCTCCRIVYWRSGCRHGTASLDRQFLHEMWALAERWHHAMYTQEEEAARLPEHLRPFWGKRVFHPAPEAGSNA